MCIRDSRTPQRRIDRGALLGAAYREFLFSRLDADRILMEPEHHVLRHVAFVDQVVQVGGIERILVDEDGVFTVSYTHLDVYKRQAIPIRGGSLHPRKR